MGFLVETMSGRGIVVGFSIWRIWEVRWGKMGKRLGVGRLGWILVGKRGWEALIFESVYKNTT
jgi:hypothetical protein